MNAPVSAAAVEDPDAKAAKAALAAAEVEALKVAVAAFVAKPILPS